MTLNSAEQRQRIKEQSKKVADYLQQMTQEHPITPPPELFKQWEDDILNERDNVDHVLDCAWRNGFQAGADQELEALISTVRSELAEPEPEGPTDEEIMDLMPQQMRDDLAAAARAMSGFDPDNIKAASVFRIILNRHSVDHARAVLARWGNCSAPQPIPVSKRWPEPEEMTEEEEVWVECVGYDYPIADTGDYYWEPHMWILRPITQSDIGHNPRWLPAHALPVPSHD